jgi:signal peptidase I
MENKMNNISTKKRSKILSLLLSVLTPGLGHLYNGKFIWAVAIPITFFIVYDIIYYFSLIKSFTFLLIFILFSIYVYIFSIVHSIVLAKRNPNYQLKSYNRVYIYILWPILYFGLAPRLPGDNSIVPLKIPTNSMGNTLKAGDMIFADMDYYKSIEVKRNDIVIFDAPESPHRLIIKRAIAFEGEKISIINGKIFINGKEYKEDNPNIIYENDNYTDLQETVIPKDHIFFIGDNRPNSLDSRMFGAVSEKNVRGKPLYVFLSNSFDRIGITLQ